MTETQFWLNVQKKVKENPTQRYGQVTFNYLSDIKPNLAEQVRGTNKDPFHVEALNDPRFERFCDFLKDNWD